MMTHFIDGQWLRGSGEAAESVNPATNEVIWQGRLATSAEVRQAYQAARQALTAWAQRSFEQRVIVVQAYVNQLMAQRELLAEAIAQDAAKPLWEARLEVDAMINKVAISITAYQQRCRDALQSLSGVTSITRHKPHGVIVVVGPFNFPGHMPNGHIVPALLAGNTVVFKPSRLTPLVAEKMVQCWQQAGLPKGVLNLIQANRQTAKILWQEDVNGVFFTGSYASGKALHEEFAGRPEVILALEMGGNNPLIVGEVGDSQAAAFHIIQSAFVTAGQRCTCARRLMLPQGQQGDEVLDKLLAMTKNLTVGRYTDKPEPFMSALISAQAAEKVMQAQQNLQEQGGRPLLLAKLLQAKTGFCTPGIMDVTAVNDREDREIFGPLLQLIRYRDFDEAIALANDTQYGLVAGLLSDNEGQYQQFCRDIRAGVLSWNRPTAGAANEAPFGGIKHSGNHRPAGFYMADSCVYPEACLQVEQLVLPAQRPPGVEVV